jgi:ectoine hydroxylase-related dioxygenase (phytanoyl-CoA dioxygenase family)
MLLGEQINEFHKTGFLHIESVIQGRELEELREAAQKVEDDAVNSRDPYHYYQFNDDESRTYYRSERLWGRAEIFQAVTVNPRLLECVGQCIGEPFYPLTNSLVNKLPTGDVPIHWHQDAPYSDATLTETYEVPHFTVDVYLDRATLENGCVWGIPQHHLVGHVNLARYTEQELFEKAGAIPFEVEAGDVLFHCLSAPHGSAGNKSAKSRRTLYLQYITRDDFFYEHYGKFTELYGEKRTPRELLAARQRLSLGGLDNSRVRLLDDSEFVFIGEPQTSPRHWRSIIAAVSEAEKQRKRKLLQSSEFLA